MPKKRRRSTPPRHRHAVPSAPVLPPTFWALAHDLPYAAVGRAGVQARLRRVQERLGAAGAPDPDGPGLLALLAQEAEALDWKAVAKARAAEELRRAELHPARALYARTGESG